MYAADRAEHVASVISPALDRGAIVITDRYVDSSLAYQGAGRNLPVEEIARFNWWATGGRVPDLTILLDMDPIAGLSRRTRSADRLEAEPAAFHLRVRAGFRALARPTLRATWCSTRTGRPTRSPATSRAGSAACSPTQSPRWPRPPPATSPRSRNPMSPPASAEPPREPASAESPASRRPLSRPASRRPLSPPASPPPPSRN